MFQPAGDRITRPMRTLGRYGRRSAGPQRQGRQAALRADATANRNRAAGGAASRLSIV